MKKYLIILFFGLLFFVSPSFAQQTPNEVRLYLFYGKGCPHCTEEEKFLKDLEKQYSNLKILNFEIWYNKNNQKILQEVAVKLNTKTGSVPFTVIGDQYVLGFNKSIGEEIKYYIDYCSKYKCKDVVGEILGITTTDISTPSNNSEEITNNVLNEQKNPNESIPETLSLPLLGEIKTANLSLPVLTIIIGALDGFNPCAMWVLIFLISLLLGIDNKLRRWILGGTFIFASAFVYFLFLAAWLNLFLFIGLIFWVRILIGLVAVGIGSYNLKDYFKNKEMVCKVTNNEKRQKIFTKLKEVAQSNNFILALGGIIIVAFAVNLVELICSAGLPAIYTNILSLSDLATWQYYGYLLLYVFVFLIDDLLIFIVAMITMNMTGLGNKYSRYANLIGGILMLILGIILVLKPELLMFG